MISRTFPKFTDHGHLLEFGNSFPNFPTYFPYEPDRALFHVRKVQIFIFTFSCPKSAPCRMGTILGSLGSYCLIITDARVQ